MMLPWVPWITWGASMVTVASGMLSTWVLRDHPRWAMRAATVMTIGGMVTVGNEALRPEVTGFVGVWVLILGATILNLSTCHRAERQHHRRVMETQVLLYDLARMHRERARLLADEAMQRRGEPPPKEC